MSWPSCTILMFYYDLQNSDIILLCYAVKYYRTFERSVNTFILFSKEIFISFKTILK